MPYLVLSIIIILGLIGKRKKIIFCILFFMLWALFGLNISNPDFINYYNAYNNIFDYSGNISEPIFQALMRLVKLTGLSYQHFLIIISFISLFLIAKTVWDFSPYPSLVLSMYFLYPFTLDVVQCRNTLGYAVVIFSFRYIVGYQRKKEKKYLLLYICFLLVATGIHFSCALYLIILAMFIKNNALRRIIIIVLPVLVAVFLFNMSSFVPFISKFIGDFKTLQWTNRIGGISLSRRILTLILKLGLVIICYFSISLYKDKDFPLYLRNNHSLSIYTVDYHFISKVIYEIILYLFSLSIFEILVSSTFERLGRPAVIFSYVLLTRSLATDWRGNRAIEQVLIFCCVITFFVYYMLLTPGDSKWIDTVFKGVLDNNLLY